MESLRDNLRNNIAYYLQKNGLKNKELAKELGVSAASVTNWITGKNSPDIELVAKMCDLFDVSITEMMSSNHSTQSQFSVTNHEKDVIIAYRKQPELQYAVDRLLNVETSETLTQKKNA